MNLKPGFVFSPERHSNFLSAAKGLTAHQTARVMTKHGTKGINWSGCGKREMAEAYSYGVAFSEPVSENVIRELFKAERSKPKTINGKLGTWPSDVFQVKGPLPREVNDLVWIRSSRDSRCLEWVRALVCEIKSISGQPFFGMAMV